MAIVITDKPVYDLIRFGDYVPPNITQCDFDFDNVTGSEDATEAGGVMREVVVAEAPTISLTFTAVNQVDAAKIMEILYAAEIPVTFYADKERTATMYCESKSMQLIATMVENTEQVRYFTISAKLKHY